MLAIISDLHFCDGTATKKNVDPRAFALALGDVYEQAAGLAAKQGGKAHVDLVMLGDVFDLLRTEAWFAVPRAERPWGTTAALDGTAPAAATLEHAGAILAKIVQENADALATLRGELTPPPPGVEVRRILLPGNHDRLALHDEGLYATMRAAVGAADERTLASEGIFPHRLEMKQYGLLARHGHEWDAWNFEAHRPDATSAQYDDADYLLAPIGDPITTELAARLPYEMKLRLEAVPDLTQADKDDIYLRLQRVEDVRPLFASIPWVYREAARLQSVYGGTTSTAVHAALEDALRTIVGEFSDLDFFGAWYERHHKSFRLDGPKQLKEALALVRDVTIETIQRIAPAFDGLLGGGDDEKEPCSVGAAAEKLDSVGTEGMRFVVYGHTHQALQIALTADDRTRSTYLNSGTFRQRVFRTEDKKGFISSDYMTYLCFFSADEAATWRDPRARLVGPTYAAWTGMRNR